MIAYGVTIDGFMAQVRAGLEGRSVAKRAVPEQYVILRALLFAKEYWA